MSDCSRRRSLEHGLRAGAGALLWSRLSGCGGAPLDGTVAVAAGTALLTFAQFPKLTATDGGVVVDAGGVVLGGPARSSLRSYAAAVAADGITVTVA
jgi:hypothetical protein